MVEPTQPPPGPTPAQVRGALAERFGERQASEWAIAFGAELPIIADEMVTWGEQPPGDPSGHPRCPWHPTRHKTPKRGFVYVATTSERVKIGFSAKPEQRFRLLRRDAPGLRLVRVEPGTTSDEWDLFDRFAACRVNGEWFEPDDEMRAWLDELAT